MIQLLRLQQRSAVKCTCVKGRLFGFRVILPRADPDASAAFLRAQVSSLLASAITADSAGSEESTWDFARSPAWTVGTTSASGANADAGVAAATPMTVRFQSPDFDNQPTQVSLQIDGSGDGSGSAALHCVGAPPVNLVLRSPEVVSGTVGRRITRCNVIIAMTPGLRILRIQIIAHGTTVAPRAAQRWLPKGDYKIRAFGRSGRPVSAPITIDGKNVRGELRLYSDGWHAVGIGRSVTGLSSLAVLPRGWDPNILPVHVLRTAAARWHVTVRAPETLEAAVLPDGWWQLRSTRRTYRGRPCDVVNTCFNAVESGVYELSHRWPPSIIAGFSLSVAAWIFSLGVTALPYARPRRPR